MSPVPDVDCAGRVVEEFARPVGGVASLGEASLKGFDLGVIHEVIGALVASGGGSELARKNGRPAGSAEDPGGVGVAEVDSALGQLVDIRSDGPWRFAQATNPVVHVVDREQEDVGFVFGQSRKGKKGSQKE